MKTIYRVGPGRFINLDSHVQPADAPLLPPPSPSRRCVSRFLRFFAGCSDCFFRHSTMTKTTSPTTNSTETGTSEKSSINTASSIANAAGGKGTVEPPRAEQEP